MNKKLGLEVAHASRSTDVPSPRRIAFVYGSFKNDSHVTVDTICFLTDEEIQKGRRYASSKILKRPWIWNLYQNGKNKHPSLLATTGIFGTVDEYNILLLDFSLKASHAEAKACLNTSGSDVVSVGSVDSEQSLDDLLRQKVFERIGHVGGYHSKPNSCVLPYGLERMACPEQLEIYLIDQRDGLLHPDPAEKKFSELSLREFAVAHQEYGEIVESMISLSRAPSKVHRKAIRLEIQKASAMFAGDYKEATRFKKIIENVLRSR